MWFAVKFAKQSLPEGNTTMPVESHPNTVYTKMGIFARNLLTLLPTFFITLKLYGLTEPGEGAEAVQLSESLP
jgi:hypothetical protein